MFGWFRSLSVFSLGRTGKWAKIRREHLEREPVCQACGRSKDLEVHHVVPVHVGGAKAELDQENLITLCADPCHFVHGHLMSWSRWNPECREDCRRYRDKIKAAC